jgi:hypothetical protein
MMWRGTVYSTLLHGSIVIAVLVGIPVLPKIFDRDRETELGQQSIPIEIVSADSIDLRQNIVAPDNQAANEPAPAATTGALQPLVISKTEPEPTDPTPVPSAPPARADKTRIPEGALNRPQSENTSRSQIQKQPRRDAVRERETQAAQQTQAVRKTPPVPKPSPARSDPASQSLTVSVISPSPVTDAAKPAPPSEQVAEQTAEQTAEQLADRAAVGVQPPTASSPPASTTRLPDQAAATARQATAETIAVEARTGSRASAGGNELIQAVRGRKRELVVQILETDTRLRQAVTPRPDSVRITEQARTKTLQRLRKSATSGFPHAQYNLAGKYLRGEDVPKDSAEAVKWLTRAAQQSYLPAQTLLGTLRFTGLGVPQDQAEAAFWWSLAADAGDDGAKIGTELIQPLLKPRELIKSKRLRARWGSLINDLADLTAGNTNRRDLDDELRKASERGDLDAVLSLLASGADADEAGDEGRNAVINAAWRGRERIMQLLLERGVATELPDNSGRTPLMWAAINGHSDIVRNLVESGANPDQTDRDGGTALIRAAWNGHADSVRSLIGAGADVNLPDDNGLTALAHARREGNATIVKALIAAGAR